MLTSKDTQELSELKSILENKSHSGKTAVDYFHKLRPHQLLKDIFPAKSSGYAVGILFMLLLLLPFLGSLSIYSFLNGIFGLVIPAKKDTYYRVLHNPCINWRLLLLRFAKAFRGQRVEKEQLKQGLESTPTCFIVDDTDLEKTGRHFEGISRIWSHVIGRHLFGFKCLVLGFWDGLSFIPLDFSLHNERGKKKNYGMSLKQRQERFSKERSADSQGAKRKKELRHKKTHQALKMIKRAVKHGIIARYVLVDSWFMNEELISEVLSIKEGAMDVAGGCRMDKRQYKWGAGSYTAAQLKRKLKSKKKRLRKYNLTYIEQQVSYKGILVKLFFCRMGKRGKWKLFLTTDLALSLKAFIKIYEIRWSIEVFFRECKQHLGLAKQQSVDFDAQIADTTLVFIRYILLSLYKQKHQYQTIGALFKKTGEELLVIGLAQKIWALIERIIRVLVEILDVEIDLDKMMRRLISRNEYYHELQLIFSTPHNRGRN